MKRRSFLTLIGSAAARPLAAWAQSERMRRIGVLMPLAEADQEARTQVATFMKGLQERGWTAGQNVRFDFRWAAGDEQRIRTFAKELVEEGCDLILARSSPVVAALMRLTRTIPIVFFQVVDPVEQGLVANLAHPGGNVTGFTIFEATIGGKWLELLKEMMPRLTRVGMIYHTDTAPFAESFFRALTATGSSVVKVPISDAAEIDSAIASFATEGSGGLIVLPNAFAVANRKAIVAAAAQHRVPAIYPFRFFAEIGGLMSYGNDPAEAMRQAAVYGDRILNGANPANLPVQASTRFQLVINRKAASALAIDVPETLLARAEEVIE